VKYAIKYAVNISDMAYPELAIPAQFMVGPAVGDPREVVGTVKGQIDSAAVVLNVEPDQALAICQFMAKAGKDKIGRAVRCYVQGPKGGWKKV
jgi:hypothetical protein